LFCDNRLFDVSKNLRHTGRPSYDANDQGERMTYLKYFLNRSDRPVARAATFLIAPVIAMGVLATTALSVQAQTIYRCPSKDGITPYTNDKIDADRQGCTPMTGGNVTVVQGTKVFNNAAPSPAAASPGAKEGKDAPVRVANAPQAGSRIDGAEQRSRDSDSKAIFESELRKAEAKQAELLKEYNNGEPEKRGSEAQNYQKYLDRVAEMKASIARNDSDIASIKRELGRASSSARSP
jgi:hypothetical protein